MDPVTAWSDRPYNQPILTGLDGADTSIPFTLAVNGTPYVWPGSTVTSTITDDRGVLQTVPAFTWTAGASGAGTLSLTSAQKVSLGVGNYHYTFTIAIGAALQFAMAGQFSIALGQTAGTTTAGIGVTSTNGVIAVAITATPGLASNIALNDAGGFYAASNVEAALAELPAAFGVLTRSPTSGRYFRCPGNQTTAAATLNRLCYLPIETFKAFTMDRIGCLITVGAGSSTVRLGIYASGASGMPGALILDAGTIDSTGTGLKEINISQLVPAGRIWLAAVAQGGTPTTQVITQGVVTANMGFVEHNPTGVGPATATALLQSNVGNFYEAGVSGALPVTANSGFDNSFVNALATVGRAL